MPVKPNLGRELDKGAFRRKIADPTLLPVSGEFLRGPQRRAQLYRAAAKFQLLGERTKSTNPSLRTSPETQAISA
jgi:hypothetical protein